MALCLALIVGFALAGHGYNHGHEYVESVSGIDLDNLSLDELDAQLQVSSSPSRLRL